MHYHNKHSVPFLPFHLLISALLLSYSLAVDAQGDDYSWSLSPFLGVHSASPRLINEGAFKAPLAGETQIIDPNGFLIPQTLTFQNELPELDPGTVAGLEFQLHLSNRNALIFGAGSWESGSSATTTTGAFPIQGEFFPVVAERRAKLSYTEFFLGWKHNALRRPGKYNLYWSLTGHELFDVDYRDTLVFEFLSGTPDAFKRILVTESQATGVFMLQLGFGAERWLNDWLSVGLESNYLYSLKSFQLRDVAFDTNFSGSDNILLNPPTAPDPDGSGNMAYLSQDATEYKDLTLKLDGWKVLFRFNIYY